MLSFLSYRKPDYSDSEDNDDIEDHPNDLPMPRSLPKIVNRFDDLSVDTIDYADGVRPQTIANDLRPESKPFIGGENDASNGNGKSTNGAVPKVGKSTVRTRSEVISDKKKAENIYSANKSVAESMMDIALLTSNANQLKFLLSYNTKSKTFYINVTLIAFSLILQVAVGLSLIIKKNLRGKRSSRATHFINQFVVIGIFLVTVINVFVAAFTTADS